MGAVSRVTGRAAACWETIPPIHHAAIPGRSRETLLCNVKKKSSLTRLGAVPQESHGAHVGQRQEDHR